MNCAMCCGYIGNFTEEDRALLIAEAVEKYEDFQADELVPICDSCDVWIQDIERIARGICIENDLDPEIIITKMDANFEPDRVPTWVSFVEDAKLLTKIPSPGVLSKMVKEADRILN